MTRWRRWIFILLAVTNFDASGQTTPVPFTLSLELQNSVANGVLVTFQGVEDGTLPDCFGAGAIVGSQWFCDWRGNGCTATGEYQCSRGVQLFVYC